jgi:hypothetical protein
MWKSWAPLRVKLFLWLACRRKIWTADRRRRRGLDAHDTCSLCDQQPETRNHLLVVCPVAKEAYWRVLSWARCVCTFGGEETVQEWWEHLTAMQVPRRRKGVATLFIIIAWHLWKERNARLFDRVTTPMSGLIDRIKAEAELWVVVEARKLGRL